MNAGADRALDLGDASSESLAKAGALGRRSASEERRIWACEKGAQEIKDAVGCARESDKAKVAAKRMQNEIE